MSSTGENLAAIASSFWDAAALFYNEIPDNIDLEEFKRAAMALGGLTRTQVDLEMGRKLPEWSEASQAEQQIFARYVMGVLLPPAVEAIKALRDIRAQASN